MLLGQVTPVSHPHNDHALIHVQERKEMLQHIQGLYPKAAYTDRDVVVCAHITHICAINGVYISDFLVNWIWKK